MDENFASRYESLGKQVEAAEVLGWRRTFVDGVEVKYTVAQFPDTAYVFPDGRIYVNELLDAPERTRTSFQTLIAYHETVEFGLHEDSGIPFPRGHLEGEQIELGLLFHQQAHFMELVAAKNMGILKEYVEWRPMEVGCTAEFVRRIDPELGEELYAPEHE